MVMLMSMEDEIFIDQEVEFTIEMDVFQQTGILELIPEMVK